MVTHVLAYVESYISQAHSKYYRVQYYFLVVNTAGLKITQKTHLFQLSSKNFRFIFNFLVFLLISAIKLDSMELGKLIIPKLILLVPAVVNWGRFFPPAGVSLNWDRFPAWEFILRDSFEKDFRALKILTLIL